MLSHEFTCCHLTNRLLPGGNIVLADNGPMFKEMYAAQAIVLPLQKCNNQRMLTAELKAAGQNCKIAYIDPSYMVRSVAADTKDSHMCYLLASQVQDPVFFEPEICFECSIACIKVVHGAMHGFTRFRSAAAAAVFARARKNC